MNNENNFNFKSRLQGPAIKVPESIMLADLSNADRNARSMVAPGSKIGEKRKTLQDTALGYDRPPPPAPSSKLPNAVSLGVSTASTSRYNPSYTTSSSMRPPSSNSSRNTSNGSNLSQSLGPGRLQSYRPGSSIQSFQQASHATKSGHRPAISLDTPIESRKEQNGQNVNSMRNFSSTTTQSIPPNRKLYKQRIVTPTTSNSSSGAVEPIHVVKRPTTRGQSLREISISTRMRNLSLNDSQCLQNEKNREESIGDTTRMPKTPQSHIPRKTKRSSNAFITQTPSTSTASPTKSPRKKLVPPIGGFLTIDSNIKCADWDVKDRLEKMETMYTDIRATLDASTNERANFQESVACLKTRNSELEIELTVLKQARADHQRQVEDLQRRVEHERTANSSMKLAFEELTRKHLIESSSLKQELDDQRRTHNIGLEDLLRQKRRELEDQRSENEAELARREHAHRMELEEEKQRLKVCIKNEKEQKQTELEALTTERKASQERIESQLSARDNDLRHAEERLEKSKAETLYAKEQVSNLTSKLSEASTTIISLESSLRSSRARVEFLESDNKSQSQAFADLEQRTQDAIRESEEAKAKLRVEETFRRRLHNQVQELKGNIRVYCRVRPAIDSDAADQARITFPDQEVDAKEIDVLGPEEKSSLGKISTKNNAFTFDRVFSPKAQNAEIFDELSQLVQSALDGYNVCIFCYGQTGSGKTHTMSSADGMIPKAVNQIYDTAMSLEEKGWKYSMEGSFVEIYNENINDLLGRTEDFDKKKHEIRHDPINLKTTITDVQTMMLDSPDRVQQVLNRAMSNRSVAATLANARSSRSHSVFILKLIGENAITGEKSEGTLNLVDLAGSERLSHSGATGDRLKETQNINKSLSCLGDVIGALGQGKEGGHIPYRNSKLTYLLQYSLGGNSKTLMFVMVSPLQAHLSETLTSLKFATKVNNTKIGTAKKQSKV